MSWWRTYAGWRARRGRIEGLGLLLILGSVAWQVFFVQWNTDTAVYSRYYALDKKLQSIWTGLKPIIWDIHNHPAGAATPAQPDLQATLTSWYDLNTRWEQLPVAQNPESLHVGLFKGFQFIVFLIGSILVVLAKVLIDEDNPLSPPQVTQAASIDRLEL